MDSALKKTDIFENAPIKKAVLAQIVPAVISQMIALVYNLADTYFVGLLDAPVQTAAITIVYPTFLMLTALSNLFGVGGASAISRSLGRKDADSAREISSVSFWGGIILSILFSLLFAVLAKPILSVCGAKGETYAASFEYAKWVIIFGAPFTVMNNLLANLVRSEGGAKQASFGVSLGGILNILLDPIFVLPQFLGLKAAGAGLATAISNAVAAVYFLVYIRRSETVLSVNPKHLSKTKAHIGNILSIGLPSALQYALTVVAVAAQAHFVAKYPTEAVAALGIIKKIDNLPLYFSIGVSNGLLPLLAFNHAAGNISRRKSAFTLGAAISLGFALLCLVLYEAFAPALVGLFIENSNTVAYGADFLRIMVLTMPMMSVCYPMIIQFQAMGRARESLICSILRKGVLDIPLLLIMDKLWPLYGCMCVQPIVDTIALTVAIFLYLAIRKHEKAETAV